MERKGRTNLGTVHPTKLHYPRMVDREGVVQKDDVSQSTLLAQLEQLDQDVVVRAPPAIVDTGRILVQLVVHARSAIRAAEGAAPLGGHVDGADRFVEQVARQERQAIERSYRCPQRWSVTSALPDVGD